jgi:hypothetical protein
LRLVFIYDLLTYHTTKLSVITLRRFRYVLTFDQTTGFSSLDYSAPPGSCDGQPARPRFCAKCGRRPSRRRYGITIVVYRCAVWKYKLCSTIPQIGLSKCSDYTICAEIKSSPIHKSTLYVVLFYILILFWYETWLCLLQEFVCMLSARTLGSGTADRIEKSLWCGTVKFIICITLGREGQKKHLVIWIWCLCVF